jgi:hypothetical protein
VQKQKSTAWLLQRARARPKDFAKDSFCLLCGTFRERALALFKSNQNKKNKNNEEDMAELVDATDLKIKESC